MGKECEKDGGYWDSNAEMTARALPVISRTNCPTRRVYLAGHADCALTLVSGKDGEMEVLKASLWGKNARADANTIFDEIIEDSETGTAIDPCRCNASPTLFLNFVRRRTGSYPCSASAVLPVMDELSRQTDPQIKNHRHRRFPEKTTSGNIAGGKQHFGRKQGLPCLPVRRPL